MRTLNRPMFRYGGPIKEGVMNGIREPKRNGGPMVKQAALVGNPAYPQTAGREHHRFNIFGLGSKAGNVAKVGTGGQTSGIVTQALKNFYNKARSKITTIPKTRTNTPQGPRPDGTPMFKTQTNIPMMERIKMFGKANPKTTIGAGTVGMTSGVIPDTVGAIGTGIKNTGLQIADLLVSDKYFDQDKYFADKKKAKKDAENTTTLNTDLKKLLEQPVKPKKSEKEIRAEQIAKYRDIVDIKGMSKDAAYDSLIAASQAISGSGDFKGDIKSGKLINQIIQGTSKAFDKPKATKDAIDTLILKGELEKDMNKDKNAIMDTYRMKQIALADKQLAGGDFSENKALFAKNMSGQQLFDSAAAKSSPNFMGNLINKKGLTDLMTEAKKSGDIVERDIIITATEELIKGKGVPNGDYTVGDVLVTIVEGKVANVTR